SVTDGQNIDVNFTFTRDGVNITGNVSIINVTVGGQACVMRNLSENGAYRQKTNITNSMASAVTSYQINLTVDTSSLIATGKMRSDCGDVRFYNSTGSMMDYWIESGCGTTSTRIWIEVPNIPASGSEIVSMYYGNLTLTSRSNGDDTFIFFDDFTNPSNAVNTTKWSNVTGGTYSMTVANSNLTQQVRNGKAILYSYTFNTTPFAAERRFLIGSEYNTTHWYRDRFWINGVQDWSWDEGITDTGIDDLQVFWGTFTGAYVSFNRSMHLVQTVNATNYSFMVEYVDGTLIYDNMTGRISAAPFNISSMVGDPTDNNMNGSLKTDWVFVRKSGGMFSKNTAAEESSPAYGPETGAWSAICAVPSGLNGLQNLVINANATDYSDGTASGTQPSSVQYPGAQAFTYISSGNVGSNTTSLPAWSGVNLYANWSTNATNLGWAVLATNETGAWQNKTGAIDIDAATLTWSNFTWYNDSVAGNTVVGWRIFANNSDGTQNVTDINTFTVQSSVLITLTSGRDTVNFNSMASGTSNDTADDKPLPFEIRNDGNVKANITINATSLFTISPNPNSAYRAAANTSTEGTTYNAACTNTSWFNMPASGGTPPQFICFLDWLNSTDQVETEIAIAVPNSEPSGAKTSTVTFIGTMA
ncbi:MAG: DUF2341 domain-containing protein, partial [Candidatus Aenigmatarchaeota archaeon]